VQAASADEAVKRAIREFWHRRSAKAEAARGLSD